jgi:hypothetical protein
MTVLALISLAACGEGSPSTPVATTASPTRSAGPIPAAALLQPSDLNGATMRPVDGDVGKDLRPPRPCGGTHPSDPARRESIAMTAPVTPATGPGGTVPSVILETIVRYNPGSGAQAFAELRSALQRCPGAIGKDKRNWEILDAGDEMLVFRTSKQTTYGDSPDLTTQTWPAAAALVGDDVVLVADLGWENMSGEEPAVRSLITQAVLRLRATS